MDIKGYNEPTVKAQSNKRVKPQLPPKPLVSPQPKARISTTSWGLKQKVPPPIPKAAPKGSMQISSKKIEIAKHKIVIATSPSPTNSSINTFTSCDNSVSKPGISKRCKETTDNVSSTSESYTKLLNVVNEKTDTNASSTQSEEHSSLLIRVSNKSEYDQLSKSMCETAASQSHNTYVQSEEPPELPKKIKKVTQVEKSEKLSLPVPKPRVSPRTKPLPKKRISLERKNSDSEQDCIVVSPVNITVDSIAGSVDMNSVFDQNVNVRLNYETGTLRTTSAAETLLTISNDETLHTTSDAETLLTISNDEKLHITSDAETLLTISNDEKLHATSDAETLLTISNDETLHTTSDAETLLTISNDEKLHITSDAETLLTISNDEKLHATSDAETLLTISNDETLHATSDAETLLTISKDEKLHTTSDAETLLTISNDEKLHTRTDSITEKNVGVYECDLDVASTLQDHNTHVEHDCMNDIDISFKIEVENSFIDYDLGTTEFENGVTTSIQNHVNSSKLDIDGDDIQCSDKNAILVDNSVREIDIKHDICTDHNECSLKKEGSDEDGPGNIVTGDKGDINKITSGIAVEHKNAILHEEQVTLDTLSTFKTMDRPKAIDNVTPDRGIPQRPPRPKRMKTLIGIANVFRDVNSDESHMPPVKDDGKTCDCVSSRFTTENHEETVRVRTGKVNSLMFRKSQSDTALNRSSQCDDSIDHFYADQSRKFDKHVETELFVPVICDNGIANNHSETYDKDHDDKDNDDKDHDDKDNDDKDHDDKDNDDKDHDDKVNDDKDHDDKDDEVMFMTRDTEIENKENSEPHSSSDDIASNIIQYPGHQEIDYAFENRNENSTITNICGEIKFDLSKSENGLLEKSESLCNEPKRSGVISHTSINSANLSVNQRKSDNISDNIYLPKIDNDGYLAMDVNSGTISETKFDKESENMQSLPRTTHLSDITGDNVYISSSHKYENQTVNQSKDELIRSDKDGQANIPLVDRSLKPSLYILKETSDMNAESAVGLNEVTSEALDKSPETSFKTIMAGNAPPKPLRLSQRLSKTGSQEGDSSPHSCNTSDLASISTTLNSKVDEGNSILDHMAKSATITSATILPNCDVDPFSTIPPPCVPVRKKKVVDDLYIYPDPVPIEFAPDHYWIKAGMTVKTKRPYSEPVSDNVDFADGWFFKTKALSMCLGNAPSLKLVSHQLTVDPDFERGVSDISGSSVSIQDVTSSSEDAGQEEDTDHGRVSVVKKDKLYCITEEMMTSEQTYLDVLKLLNIDLRHSITQATEAAGKSIVPTTTLNMILEFLPSLQGFSEELLKDLTYRINNWKSEGCIADIFIRKGPFLKLATSYIRNFQNSTNMLDDTRRRYVLFDAAIKQFEESPRCANLAVRHYMLKPVQRIPQYKLLLQDYMKYLPEDSEEYTHTKVALATINEVANHANESMKKGDAVQEMLNIQNSLIGRFEVITPGREFLKKGELMKLSRKEMQPRMFFLFTDVLLYTTPVSGSYKLRDIFLLAGMKVTRNVKDESGREFSIISLKRSFYLAASGSVECEAWVNSINTAIAENLQRRSTFDGGISKKGCESVIVGEQAPIWIPDARVTMCQICTCEFSMTWRRHHCRCCGKVVCEDCSSSKAPLKYLNYKIQRVCSECYQTLDMNLQEHEKVSDHVLGPAGGEAISISSLRQRFSRIRRSFGKGVKRRPAVLQEVRAGDTATCASGYLQHKKGKRWRKFWFVIKDHVLYTYKASEDMAAIESLPLLGYAVHPSEMVYEGVEPGFVFVLTHANTEPVVLRTESLEATERWIQWVWEAVNPS